MRHRRLALLVLFSSRLRERTDGPGAVERYFGWGEIYLCRRMGRGLRTWPSTPFFPAVGASFPFVVIGIDPGSGGGGVGEDAAIDTTTTKERIDGKPSLLAGWPFLIGPFIIC